jgi:hypothetical protein
MKTVRHPTRVQAGWRMRVRPEAVSGFYAARSRDVSQGAPEASRVEERPANETDFGPDGPLEPGETVRMPQWHPGVTN